MVYDQVKRDKAKARALKWQKLFKEGIFDDIVDAAIAGGANPPKKFTDACNKEKMTPEEQKWLWNYLQHCGNLWAPDGVLEAAAGTGW